MLDWYELKHQPLSSSEIASAVCEQTTSTVSVDPRLVDPRAKRASRFHHWKLTCRNLLVPCDRRRVVDWEERTQWMACVRSVGCLGFSSLPKPSSPDRRERSILRRCCIQWTGQCCEVVQMLDEKERRIWYKINTTTFIQCTRFIVRISVLLNYFFKFFNRQLSSHHMLHCWVHIFSYSK